jgi:hypothetical protein
MAYSRLPVEEERTKKLQQMAQDALSRAIKKGKPKLVEYLLSSTIADANELNSDQNSPLFVAIRHSSLVVLKYLLNHGALVHQVCPLLGHTAVVEAARSTRKGSFGMMKCLIEYGGASLNDCARDGASLLFIQIGTRNQAACVYLIRGKGVDLNAHPPLHCKSLAHYAVQRGMYDIAKRIYRSGRFDISCTYQNKTVLQSLSTQLNNSMSFYPNGDRHTKEAIDLRKYLHELKPCGLKECRNGGRRRCKRCETMIYCSRDCQTADWKKNHKPHCKPASEAASAQERIHIVLQPGPGLNIIRLG